MNELESIGPEEERALGRAIQEGRRAQRALDSVQRSGESEARRERSRARLSALVSAGNAARGKLIDANLGLVIELARGYPRQAQSLAYLVQEGNKGLMKAAERFEPDRGTRFADFALFWIRQRIRVALKQQELGLGKGKGQTLPVEVRREVAIVREAIRRLEGQLERQPLPDEVARETGLDPSRVGRLIRWSQGRAQPRREVGGEGDRCYGDLVFSPGADAPRQSRQQAEIERLINVAIAMLEPREVFVLVSHFGLDGNEPRSCAEIAEQLGLSSAGVRRIKSIAMDKLGR